METRKVQITGRSTYIISLPKTWVKKIGITNGDSIGLIPRSDGTLLVKPKIGRETNNENISSIGINVESQDLNEFTREFIGVYLAGYNIINMKFDKPISERIRQKIRELSHVVIGPEIIDESNNSITVKDLLDASDFSIVKGVKRMYVISRGMYADALNSLANNDINLADDVKSRDKDVDKLYWLVSKQFNLVVRDLFFAEKMGIHPQQALGYLLVARSIERIADHATKFVLNVKNIEGSRTVVSTIVNVGRQVLKLFDDAITSLYRNEYKHAHLVLSESNQITKKIDKLRKEIASVEIESEMVVSLAYILESIERVGSYSEDIAEAVINHHYVQK